MEQFVSLKEALSPLKESSMAAIADATCKSFDKIKSYLHLERNIELQLRQFLEQVKRSNSKKLFLVCGNVGDGKSHLLASIGISNPELYENVILHNDATESSDPDESFIDELNKLLNPFSDKNINNGNEKIIVAINLGTLNNFIASDINLNFKKLHNYVKEKKIFDVGSIVECSFDNESPFQFVNFCDHNLFYLTASGPDSDLIENAISRVVNQNGPFYEAYKQQKLIGLENCPICYNFEILQMPEIRRRISRLLIECIVMGEIIISIRALYNFIYELIVPIDLEPLDNEATVKRISQYSVTDFLENIIPNYIYSHPELSNIFEQINKHDPAIKRAEIIDDAIIELVVSDSPVRILNQYIQSESMGESVLKALAESSGTEDYIKAFIRFSSFWPRSDRVLVQDETYDTFMGLMYTWYSGNSKALKTLYQLVQNAINSWKGQAGQGKINVDIGKQQLEYRISQSLDVKPEPPAAPVPGEGNINEFNTFIPVRYRVNGNIISLAITYNLFQIFSKIKKGYRTTSLDHSNFIIFDEFVQKAENGCDQNNVFFTESANKKQFSIELDDFGDFCFNEVES